MIVGKLFTFISFLVLVLVHVEETREEGNGAIVKCFGALGKKETEEEFNFFRGDVSTLDTDV